MVIISHDRHFLNSVCTHMADLDYGTLRVYPGNYDDYMIASTQARERLLSANSKAKDRIVELQDFVRRFSANKARSKQATSRIKMIEKLKPDDVKPSSRQNPYIRFDYDPKQKLHRHAVEVDGIAKGWPGMAKPLFADLSFTLEAGAAPGDHRTQRRGQDNAAANADRRSPARCRNRQVGRARDNRLLPAGPDGGLRAGHEPARLDGPLDAAGRR